MKNSIITVVAILSFFGAFAQKNIPAEVKTSFSKQYPLIKKVKWEKENGNYEAGFTEDKIGKSVLLDAKGKILETEAEIPVTTLSKSITDYVSKNYPKQKIKSAAKITDSNKKITFEAEVNGQDLLFDEKGNLIKASKD
ncbi:PepSY-like domain-containing protein [Flavobacterium sp. SUN052]|uniref:PepSY-like domain-containing protein n=1 Tax=Flavobacterium sp. SUN052 TaxID=3002441 RepID=UPI00237ED708|nr:PepSY-like domain-containing protein [Flavobacterium sp. SUN052]MEC4003399.1 PepSY-like domain-containing protein [Flavobacterium sp. SUN052]